MQKIVSWIKTNPISVVSIVVALVAVGVLIWVQLEGRAFRAELEKQGPRMKTIEGFSNRFVEVPGLNPGDPPRNVGPLTINQAANEQIRTVFAKMGDEYAQVFKEAVKINKAGHEPMRPDLFPTPRGDDALYGAMDRYRQSVAAMLDPPGEDALLPGIDAGPPLDMTAVAEEMARVEAQYRMEIVLGEQGQMAPDQFEELQRRQREQLAQIIRRHTESVSIYAQTDPAAQDFALEIPQWVQTSSKPSEMQLWHGQMTLWIQQDILRAIQLANSDVGGTLLRVTDAPVKRLISIDVLPGSVGIRNQGAFAGGSGADPFASTGGGGTVFTNPQPGFDPESPDSAAAVETTLGVSADQKLPDDFSIAPTGRFSNALYDVWHARLVVVADAQQLPALFNAINRVNFMTVLKVEIKDVDEYAAMREGFVYGPHDVVEVTMLIETIWLREWTARWMPASVRAALGMPASIEG